MNYDSWKLQTPEEYAGYRERNCIQCGYSFEAPASEPQSICDYCTEENNESERSERSERSENV